MDQVASKCYLGLIIQEVIKQLGLQKMTKKIYDAYFQAFKSHYQNLKGSYSQTSKTDGKLYQHFQYPIGQKQNLQYYLAYGDMVLHLPSIKNGSFSKSNQHSMLQGFSTNQGAKAKAVRRQRKETSKNPNTNSRKKKNN